MAHSLNPYINFNGNAREAMEFYKSIFGGTLEADTFKSFNEQSGGAMPVAPEDNDKIMHATLKGDNGIVIMASDTPSGMPYEPGQQRISMALTGDDETALRGYWDRLADGGNITMPLEKAEWGDIFGMVTDKYGIDWMIDINPVGQPGAR